MLENSFMFCSHKGKLFSVYTYSYFSLCPVLNSFAVLFSCVQAQRVPTAKNGFKQGMKLEGIDPQHPSMYFVLTVAEVSEASVKMGPEFFRIRSQGSPASFVFV